MEKIRGSSGKDELKLPHIGSSELDVVSQEQGKDIWRVRRCRSTSFASAAQPKQLTSLHGTRTSLKHVTLDEPGRETARRDMLTFPDIF